MKVEIGQRVASLRRARGLKGYELARQLGIAPLVSRYEKGHDELPPLIAIKLALMFETTLDYLYCRDRVRLRVKAVSERSD